MSISILVVAIKAVARLFTIYTSGSWFTFEFINDGNSRIFAGEYIYSKTYAYRHTHIETRLMYYTSMWGSLRLVPTSL